MLSRRLLAAEPAPYSFKHGDFEVTVISDGQLQLPATLLGVDTPEEERAAFLKAAGIGETVTPAVNLTLIKSGNDLILFDTGAGPNMTADGRQVGREPRRRRRRPGQGHQGRLHPWPPRSHLGHDRAGRVVALPECRLLLSGQ